MQNPRSHLLLVFGLVAPHVSADLLQNAARNFSTPTTLVTMTSAHGTVAGPVTDTTTISTSLMNTALSASPTDTQSPSDDESTLNQILEILPTLSIKSNYNPPTPTPGSIAILNGIPTRVLADTTIADAILPNNILADDDGTPILADEIPHPPAETVTVPPNAYQPWNLSYPGPIHDGDWRKYLQIWDPVWWSANLDHMRQTACLCSYDDFTTNPNAQLASYINFEFYSHTTGTSFAMDWFCGPEMSSMTRSERILSGKGKAEKCWVMAGGEYAGDNRRFPEYKGYVCDEEKVLCVEAWRDGKRSLKFRGHKRNYDRDGVHTWSEIQPVVRDVCGRVCGERFDGMRMDDVNHHNPSFITTFYPPKPIP